MLWIYNSMRIKGDVHLTSDDVMITRSRFVIDFQILYGVFGGKLCMHNIKRKGTFIPMIGTALYHHRQIFYYSIMRDSATRSTVKTAPLYQRR